MRTTRNLAATVALLLAALAPAAAAAPGHDAGRAGGGDLTTARQATAQYHRLEVAVDAEGPVHGLLREGTPLHECIASLDPAMPGGMGYHFINFAALDAGLDPAVPEVLVYEPTKNGGMRLVAVEYVVFEEAWTEAGNAEAPWLFGREMTYVGYPNRYELSAFYQIHVWLWKSNPHGMFADHNPRVSCD